MSVAKVEVFDRARPDAHDVERLKTLVDPSRIQQQASSPEQCREFMSRNTRVLIAVCDSEETSLELTSDERARVKKIEEVLIRQGLLCGFGLSDFPTALPSDVRANKGRSPYPFTCLLNSQFGEVRPQLLIQLEDEAVLLDRHPRGWYFRMATVVRYKSPDGSSLCLSGNVQRVVTAPERFLRISLKMEAYFKNEKEIARVAHEALDLLQMPTDLAKICVGYLAITVEKNRALDLQQTVRDRLLEGLARGAREDAYTLPNPSELGGCLHRLWRWVCG